MRTIQSVTLRITQTGATAPKLAVGVGSSTSALDRDDVEALKEACEDFLAGRTV